MVKSFLTSIIASCKLSNTSSISLRWFIYFITCWQSIVRSDSKNITIIDIIPIPNIPTNAEEIFADISSFSCHHPEPKRHKTKNEPIIAIEIRFLYFEFQIPLTK